MDKRQLVLILTGLKRFIYKAIIVVVVSGSCSFLFAKGILRLLVETANLKVYYLSLPEVLLTSVEVAIYAGIFFALPVLILLLWHEFHGMAGLKRAQGYLFVVFSILLFYVGSVFCFFIVLPSGISFLVGYQNETIKAMISIEKFARFASAMIFAFGLTFEVPIILIILGRMGILKSSVLAKTRRYAVLVIAIASALITPTPDIYNMMLLALPTYVLYEIGIVFMRIDEARARKAGSARPPP